MHRQSNFPKVFIIAEIHPQFSGDLDYAQTMILQAKLGGADAVKVQLYDDSLFSNQDRDYVTLSKAEFKALKDYADQVGIGFFASVFVADRVAWCEEVGVKYYKLASPTVKDNPKLCKDVIALGKPAFVSLGMWDWASKGMPFEGDNLTYFYCVSNYPTKLSEVDMPLFSPGHFMGYSDHTIGNAACVYAMARGAMYIEKHFTLNKSLYFPTEMGHSGAMDLDDLRQLRQYADSFSILRAKTAED